jgi:hypothetical protein
MLAWNELSHYMTLWLLSEKVSEGDGASCGWRRLWRPWERQIKQLWAEKGGNRYQVAQPLWYHSFATEHFERNTHYYCATISPIRGHTGCKVVVPHLSITTSRLVASSFLQLFNGNICGGLTILVLAFGRSPDHIHTKVTITRADAFSHASLGLANHNPHVQYDPWEPTCYGFKNYTGRELNRVENMALFYYVSS